MGIIAVSLLEKLHLRGMVPLRQTNGITLSDEQKNPRHARHAKPQQHAELDGSAYSARTPGASSVPAEQPTVQLSSMGSRQTTGTQRAYKQGRAQARRAQTQPARKQSVVVKGADWNGPAHAASAVASANQAVQSFSAGAASNQAGQYAAATRRLGGNTRPVNSQWNNTTPAPQWNNATTDAAFTSARAAARQNKASRGAAAPMGQVGTRQQRDLISGTGARARRGLPGFVKFLLLMLVLAVVALGAYWWMLNDRLSLQGEEMGDLADASLRDPFYVLVLGSDSRENSGTSALVSESGSNERSDIMLLVRVDQANDQISMLSIPRDTPVRDEEGNVMRINEAFNRGGASYAIQKVREVTGAPISHYAQVRVSNFESAIDSLGGIDVNVPVDVSVVDTLTGEEIYVAAGEQHVDGKQAQALARARHEYGVDQDVNRQGMVRQLVVSMLKSTLDRPIYQVPGAVLDLASCVGTDLSSADLMYLANAFRGGTDDMTIYSGTGPNAGDWRVDLGGDWYCYDNPEGWANVMAVMDSGGDPSTVDVNATAIIP